MSRTLPSLAPPPPIALDTLLARTTSAIRARKPDRPPADDLPRAPTATLAILQNGNSAVPVRERLADRPVALVLVTVVSTCACGRVYRSPSAYALASYEANGHSFRYSRHSAADCLALPRQHREHAQTVPFCEECF